MKKKIIHSFYPISDTMAKCLTCRADVKLNAGFHFTLLKKKDKKLFDY